MLRTIQAYFPTENDAESAKTELISFETKSLEIGRIDGDGEERNDAVVVPLAGTTQEGIGVNSAGNINSSMAEGVLIRDFNSERNDKSFEYALSAKVDQADYDEIEEIIIKNNGKILS